MVGVGYGRGRVGHRGQSSYIICHNPTCIKGEGDMAYKCKIGLAPVGREG